MSTHLRHCGPPVYGAAPDVGAGAALGGGPLAPAGKGARDANRARRGHGAPGRTANRTGSRRRARAKADPSANPGRPFAEGVQGVRDTTESAIWRTR